MSLDRSRLLCAASLLSLALGLPGLIAGCGGGKSATGTPAAADTGSAVITIDWPPREGEESRAIPSNANSIVIRIYAGEELTSLRRVIPRPASAGSVAVRFQGLPLGPLLFVAEAFSDTAGLVYPALASGSQTVTIGRDGPAAVSITLAPPSTGTGGTADSTYATVIVGDIPSTAASVLVRVLQNGQVISPEGSPPAIPRSADLPFSAVPLRLGPLPVGSLLFVATASDSAGNVVARGSTIAQLASGAEPQVSLPLTPGSGSTGGSGSGTQQPTTGGAVLNVTNVGTGDALLVVDPLPGDRTLTDPPPVQVPLQGAFVQTNLPISRVPVMVAGLPPGPWLFVVTTHTGLQTSDPVSRVGTATATVAAGSLLNLELPLGSAQSAAPPRQDGELVIRTTNITAEGVQVVLASVFDSTGRVRQQVIPHTPGVSERLASFALPGGPYTVVSAAYGGPTFDRTEFDALLAGDATTIPAGALAVGSGTVSIASTQATEVAVELRLQGASGSGSVNLAMLNVPVVIERKEAGGVVFWMITSSVVVKVYSTRDNQEITSLRQVMVPPSSNQTAWIDTDGDGVVDTPQTLVSPTAQYDQLRPLRLRIDGVPVGPVRFEVTAVRGADGTGATLGRGSVLADITTGVTPVTVMVLPHGNLGADTVLPGLSNDPSDENPAPRSRAAAPVFRWRRAFARR